VKIPKRLLSWWERLTSWAEVGARIWAGYWLLIIGSCLSLGATTIKWVEFPFSNNLNGLQLSVLRAVEGVPHLSLFSFGAIGVVVLLIGLFSFRWFPIVLPLVGAILLTLCILVPAHIAFRHPSMLRRLTEELQVNSLYNVFTKQYLTPNYGPAELIPKQVVLYTAWDRFLTTWSFLRLGWYCFGIGSLLVFAYGIGSLPGSRGLTAIELLGLPCAALTIVLIPPAIGQYYFKEASIAQARGYDQQAIADYHKAARWDAWHAQDIDLYATIGQLQKHAGIAPGSPERRISRAIALVQAGQFEPAIFEFNQAAQAGGALGAAAKEEAAQTLITLGLALYNDGGIGSAVTSWEQALAADPTQVYALYYLARGYYNIGRYEAAVEAVNRLVKIVSDHTSALANIYSIAGDSYAKLGRTSDARHYYNLSLSADTVENYWALTGLIGQ
jgi:tetratricopeptide (TPR) repeat protein